MHQVARRENERYAEQFFNKHLGVSGVLRSMYARWCRSGGYAFANSRLRKVSECLCAADGVSAAIDDQSIRDKARALAAACEDYLNHSSGDVGVVVDHLRELVELRGLVWPVEIKKKDSPEVVRDKNLAAVARVCDERWWRRRLRVDYVRRVESVMRELGQVRRQSAPYVSNYAFSRWVGAQRGNRETLAGLEIEGRDALGNVECLPLLDAVDASVANPDNRHDELMVRMRGWEEVAAPLGLQGAFLTVTCPSKYHAQLSSGRANSNFSGATPREANDYLSVVWSRIRAAWHREGIRTFGFRVVEPHHDGTPHWHMWLFFSPDDMARARKIFEYHAMAEDGGEAGADRYRCDWKIIDPEKGSAAGYIAKYVSKNITGGAIDVDFEGQCLGKDGALRARAWASVWGIRQFQQIGSASVTVWRELRRRREPLEDWEPQEAEAIRRAADAGNWAEFVDLMGGAFSGRGQQKLRALNVQKNEPNGYGEWVKKLLGVVMRGAGRVIVTRQKVWKIQPVGSGAARLYAEYEARLEKSRALRAAEPPDLGLCQ